jgi:competence protein CoiA
MFLDTLVGRLNLGFNGSSKSMKFALIDGERLEAQPNSSGRCPICDHIMMAKCGDIRIWHWAHLGGRHCDPWWDNETEWHRAWKGCFPVECQEVVHHAECGEKHIADVKTDRGWVIEFQHSYLKAEERRSRDVFYRKLVWVVDGTRRKRDVGQFERSWNDGIPVGNAYPLRRLYTDDCVLLREWTHSEMPIFLDFGQQALWWILPGRLNGWVYVSLLPRDQFIHLHRLSASQVALDFDGLVKELSGLVARHDADRRLRR